MTGSEKSEAQPCTQKKKKLWFPKEKKSDGLKQCEKVGIQNTQFGRLNRCRHIQGAPSQHPAGLSPTRTHATHPSPRPLLSGLCLGVCPDSAVVVPEEFPRGRLG